MAENSCSSKLQMKLLEEVGLSEDFLTQILASKFATEQPQIACVAKIGVGEGMVSDILRVKVKWTGDDISLPPSVVLKIPSIDQLEGLAGDESSDNMTVNSLKQFHLGEMAAYEHLPGADTKSALKLPKCYFSTPMGDNTEPGLLILEDLRAQRKGTVLQRYLSESQAEQALEQLAILHSWSLRENSWKSDVRLTKSMKALMLENAKWIMDAYKHACRHLRENFSEDFGELSLKLSETISDPEKDLGYIYELNEKLQLPDVLCHGDFTRLNMMFDREENDKLVAIYDWQLIHIGCAAEDLVTLAVTSFSREHRSGEKWLRLLRFYHEKLEQNYCQNEVVFDFETLRKACDYSWKAVMLFTVPAFPYFLQKYSNDPPVQAIYVTQFREIMTELVENLDKFKDFYENC